MELAARRALPCRCSLLLLRHPFRAGAPPPRDGPSPLQERPFQAGWHLLLPGLCPRPLRPRGHRQHRRCGTGHRFRRPGSHRVDVDYRLPRGRNRLCRGMPGPNLQATPRRPTARRPRLLHRERAQLFMAGHPLCRHHCHRLRPLPAAHPQQQHRHVLLHHLQPPAVDCRPLRRRPYCIGGARRCQAHLAGGRNRHPLYGNSLHHPLHRGIDSQRPCRPRRLPRHDSLCLWLPRSPWRHRRRSHRLGCQTRHLQQRGRTRHRAHRGRRRQSRPPRQAGSCAGVLRLCRHIACLHRHRCHAPRHQMLQHRRPRRHGLPLPIHRVRPRPARRGIHHRRPLHPAPQRLGRHRHQHHALLLRLHHRHGILLLRRD